MEPDNPIISIAVDTPVTMSQDTKYGSEAVSLAGDVLTIESSFDRTDFTDETAMITHEILVSLDGGLTYKTAGKATHPGGVYMDRDGNLVTTNSLLSSLSLNQLDESGVARMVPAWKNPLVKTVLSVDKGTVNTKILAPKKAEETVEVIPK